MSFTDRPIVVFPKDKGETVNEETQESFTDLAFFLFSTI